VKTVTLVRLCAAGAVSLTAFVLLGVAGLWGVAIAAPALVFAPSAIRGAVAERRTKRALNAELAVILGGDRGKP